MCYPSQMPSRATLSISVTPELQKFVARLVKSGRYTSASEVMREALRLLQHQERQRKAAGAEIRAKIAEGVTDEVRGDLYDGQSVMDELRTARQRRKSA